jgi:HupE / UreJ protein
MRSGVLSVLLLLSFPVGAHDVAEGDRAFIEQASGQQLIPYAYLGAKHMVTGYDHLLFLLGVIFFLYRMRQVVGYVTLFAVGHSVTLLYGVLTATRVNPYFVEAIIGFSVVYIALDNLGAFRRWFGFRPNPQAAVLLFGLVHGFGLATKVQELAPSAQGLVPNMLAFNVGIELGQVAALSAILIAMTFWRRAWGFDRQAVAANVALMAAGFVLVGYHVAGYATASGG